MRYWQIDEEQAAEGPDRVRLLLTGATGLVGRQLRDDDLPAGVELVRTASRGEGSPLAADLSKAEEARALIRYVKPTHVIHSAWETRPPGYWHDPVNEQWAEAAVSMAAEFAEQGGRRFVQVGSCAEYEWSSSVYVEGVTPDVPATPYGRAKLSAFQRIAQLAAGRFDAVEARIFFVYGPGEHPSRFVPTVCRGVLTGESPALGSGIEIRDLLSSRDIALALLHLAVHPEAAGVFNVGSGTGTRLADVARLLAEIAGAPPPALGGREGGASSPNELVADISRLRSTGWAPTQSLRTGLTETLEWWRQRLLSKADTDIRHEPT